MTREEAMAEKLVSRSELINKIYDDFEKQLEDVKKEYWIKGTNDNYKALKESGKLK